MSHTGWTGWMSAIGPGNRATNINPSLLTVCRVRKIHEKSYPNQWRYVPTDINPADLGTRGMTVQEPTDSTKWWSRPDFLCSPKAEWLKCKFDKPSCEALCERKLTSRPIDKSSTSYCAIQRLVSEPEVEEVEWHLEHSRYSKWWNKVKPKGQLEVGLSLVPVRSWVQQFVSNCRRPENQRVFGELTPV